MTSDLSTSPHVPACTDYNITGDLTDSEIKCNIGAPYHNSSSRGQPPTIEARYINTLEENATLKAANARLEKPVLC